MLRQLVRFALRQRLLVIGSTLVLIVVGTLAFRGLPVEAFPDVEDVHVQIVSQWPGHAAEEIERAVTLPIERQMNGLPQLSNLRSTSMFGLSVITLTFDDGTTDYFARQQVLERLQSTSVPAAVQPTLSSLSNSTGEIFRYTVAGPRALTEIKSIEDWVIEPAIRTVSGIADVVSFGGQVKQYQVDVEPVRMQAFGLSLSQVEQAIAGANVNAGGGYLAHGFEKQVIRGVGLFTSVHDIEDVAITTREGTPVRVRDVGSVHIGGAPREGIVAKDSVDDVVEGIVLMRKGENALQILTRLREKVQEINASLLPRDVQIVPYYDRANLVQQTVRTVEENLALGAALVLLILIVFLGDWRSALMVGLIIPLSLLIAFILMRWRGVSANLISLGAVDFGIIVDAAVVMVEAFLVRLALSPPASEEVLRRTAAHEIAPPSDAVTPAIPDIDERDFVRRASVELRHQLATIAESMGRPIVFAKLIVITAFLPIFTFQRVEKRIFSPMAFTLTFALLGSLLLSLTLIPVLASFIKRDSEALREPAAARWLHRRFVPLLDAVLSRPRATLIIAGVLLLSTLGIATRLGTEFLPALDEGNIWLTVTLPVGISLEESKVVERKVRAVLRQHPQVTRVVTHLGRPDDGTDPKGANNLEVYADLAARDSWGDIRDKDVLVARMREQLDAIPGLNLNFSQYIKDNVEEALSGVKGELVVKIFGPDLEVLQRYAGEVAGVLAAVRGVADLGVDQQFGQPQLRVQFDRSSLARNGVAMSDAADALETAVGGRAITQFVEQDRVFDVRLRYVSAARDNLAALRQLPVNAIDGHIVPLAALGEIQTTEGASRISREANERRVAVKCSVRGRDEGGFVSEAQSAVAKSVTLLPGYHMVWGGQFENQRRATRRLALIVPTSIALIFLLLFSAFGSVKYAVLVLANLPFALIGGVLTLWMRQINLSVSAAVGFIALFGISVQNGVLLVEEYNRRRVEGFGLRDAVRLGTIDRLRPIVMTALMAALGLWPAALSTGIGAETTRPFASVIVGGLVSATLLTLLLLPMLYLMFHEDPHVDLPR